MALVSFGGLTISPVKLPISLIAKLKMIWKPKKKKRIFHKEKMLVEKTMLSMGLFEEYVKKKYDRFMFN